MSNENPRFFIAYTQADKEVYKKFRKLFEEHIPTYWSVWTGSEIFIGSNWASQLNNQVNTNDYLIVLLSMNFSSSTFINTEISNLFNNKRIIPVLLKPYLFTSDSFYTDKQVFLFSRKNKNSLSFEEYIDLSNRTNEIDGTYSSSFMLDLIAFIKDANADLLIAEENHNKTGILHLNNCGLSQWPREVFQMNWLKVLNLGNYYNDFNESSNSLIHSGDKSLKPKANNRIIHIDPQIKELQKLELLSLERNEITLINNLDSNSNLITLELGGNKINKIQGLNKLIKLKSLFLYSNQITKLEGLDELNNLEFLYLGGNEIVKIEGLQKLTNLKEVYLHINKIKRLEGVNGLTNLSVLELKNNAISSIEKLINLPKLTFLSLDNNNLSKIEGLDNLKSLQRLHLENNYLKKLEGLDTLTDLILLHLENNQIERIGGLNKLQKLQQLDLQTNKIKKVKGLDGLTSLTKLDLSKNELLSSYGILKLNKLSFLNEVNFKQNPFANDSWLNQEILELIGDDKVKFFAFLEDQENKILNEDYIPPLKIILLGNSEDGKTSLSLKLIHGWDTENREDSTHGLKIRKWKIDDSKTALIYDFGGQDYYHATYNMFFTWNTGYILVWDAHRQVTQLITQSRNNDLLLFENQYRLYPTNYWLGNIDYWKRKKNLQEDITSDVQNINRIKVITIQNLFNDNTVRIIQDNNKIDSQLAAYLGPEIGVGIQKTRHDLAKESILDTFSILFNAPYPLKIRDIKIIEEIVNANTYKVLTRNEFNEKFPNDTPYLLNLLHSRGIVLHYENIESINDFVWLSPSATSIQIFNLLNLVALKQKGQVEPHLFVCEDNLKALMIHSEILFEHYVLGKLTEYIIPSYLPYSPIDDALLTLATTDIKSGFSIIFKDYMPHGIMARLICRLGRFAGINHFYRDLLIFSVYLPATDISVKVWIKVDFGELRLNVKSNVNDKSKKKLHEYLFHVILWAYWNLPHIEFATFAASTSSETNLEGNKSDFSKEIVNKEIAFSNIVNFPFYLSLDGEYFLFYPDDLMAESKSVHTHVRLFKWGDQLNNKEEYRASFNAFTKYKTTEPKKLFISYSSKDSAFMKRFTTHLEALKREGLISYWVDRMIETGTSWDDKIRREMESSDMIIYLLSPDFLATTYIMDVELPKGIEINTKNTDVKLHFIQLLHCGWKRSRLLSSVQMLLNPDNTLKDVLMVGDSNDDEKWSMIIDDLVGRLK